MYLGAVSRKAQEARMHPLLTSVAIFVFAAMAPSNAGSRLGNSCDLSVVGVSSKETFVAFDRELRAALKSGDAVAIAFLVRFPLRLNHADGSVTSLNNARALQTHFAELFPGPVVAAILAEPSDQLFCTYDGVMYGSGRLWVRSKDDTFRIEVVNLPKSRYRSAKESQPKVEFTCDAEKHRVVIDSTTPKAFRYRAWNKPHSPEEKPDMELHEGSKNVEGTSPCTHAVWTFTKGNVTYLVGELGCTERVPPKDAIGELEVSSGDTTLGHWWCF